MIDREFRPKTPAMQEFEHVHGRDIDDLLTEAYAELGNQRAVAVKFDLDPSTVSRWMRDRGIRAHRQGRRPTKAAA